MLGLLDIKSALEPVSEKKAQNALISLLLPPDTNITINNQKSLKKSLSWPARYKCSDSRPNRESKDLLLGLIRSVGTRT